MILLEVLNLSKSYKQYSSQFYRILNWFHIAKSKTQEIHILKNITFSLFQGESLGIIGQNGAGKSTLLKLITGTLKPSSGTININAKISAILELGMGFHPELTGRQNVYNSASMMGYTQEQIDAEIDSIESFAEIGHYFNEPIRIYSSGMQVRVAFALATAFKPDVLIVDEALSVGDAYFQHKCFERIKKLKEGGMSLLFVSHDKGAILALCDKAVLIDKGELLLQADPQSVMDYYNALISQKQDMQIVRNTNSNASLSTISGTFEAQVIDISLLDEQNRSLELVSVAQSVTLKVTVKVNKDLPALVLGYGIKDRLGQIMFGTNTYLTNQILKDVKKDDIYDFYISFPVLLGVGDYSIQTALVDSHTHLDKNYEWRDFALMFSVANLSKNHFVGLIYNEPTIKISRK